MHNYHSTPSREVDLEGGRGTSQATVKGLGWLQDLAFPRAWNPTYQLALSAKLQEDSASHPLTPPPAATCFPLKLIQLTQWRKERVGWIKRIAWEHIHYHGRPGFIPWAGRIPWTKEWLPTPVFLLGEFHGQRRLVNYRLWAHKELDTTEPLTHTYITTDKAESQWEFAMWYRELNPVLRDSSEGWGGVGDGRGCRREGTHTHIYTCGWFMLMYSRGQHNIAEQLSSD